ncbi:tRNA-intron lyase [Candidatus Pacearchaeota archaeon CG09_land_8_20_14_0_10_30_9]|nr:tRNA-intron lyase [Candidatus Pacearchaeota archaeon]OIO40120.1 MAG: tRNA-intron lyase [Candidatus Pacearchaeota archaeon CG1_02_30_18]PIN71393.1 MAG: tRNA-intron lyase [Candidatus Pacearchaeota archaeon CG11_big_fil_rev_8_21_14_0_20_30_13]PIO01243.1 MAG: tRNA-intron lyase [Candidatus Pacearchaeota archaeon CG09_land_8_20_14_0_10_30_9]PIZ82001.1 MAG: tRNA-intron lyase [Candidatus Pacearchaeota archaeon CG_4_10_14_0_2_um_filter_30_11]
MIKKQNQFEAQLIGKNISSNSKKAYTLSKENFFGELTSGKVIYSLQEGFFLFKNKEMGILQNKKNLNENEVLKKFLKIDKEFSSKYQVFESLRKKGLILKSGIKYGADFSVYEKGKKPGKDHSSFLLSVEPFSKKVNWEKFILKNRVANSTKKKVLLAIQDEEGNILYYRIDWIKF